MLFPLAPLKADLSNPTRYFAACVGRLSAQLEHERLFQTEHSRETEAQRAVMIDLLNAILPSPEADPDTQTTSETTTGRQVLAWRIEAKVAHAGLLTRATFRNDPWAAGRAMDMIHACTSIMIS